MDTSLKGIMETRLADFDKHLLPKLREAASADGLKIKFETLTYKRSGMSFPVLDVDKTIRAYTDPAEQKKIRSWIYKQHNLYLTKGDMKDLNTRLNHWNPLKQYHEAWKSQTGTSCSRK